MRIAYFFKPAKRCVEMSLDAARRSACATSTGAPQRALIRLLKARLVEEFGGRWRKRSGSVILLHVAAHPERDFHLTFSAVAYGLLAVQIGDLLPLIEDGFRLNLAFASMIAMESFADGTRHKHL